MKSEMFELISECPETQARTGVLHTDHGPVQTPIFMPVGTQGSVKAIDRRGLDEVGAQIILSNTYHLYLRPGSDVLSGFGGLHKFMGWNKPILTDSGGYQVFSLRDLRKITDDGVEFRSHIDGSKHFFTPESVIGMQRAIGSDIMMCFDECTPYPCTPAEAKASMLRTIEWEERCLEEHERHPYPYDFSQRLFAIGQGSIYPDLRRACLEELCSMPFDGYAIGGLAIGEPLAEMYDIVAVSTEVIPKTKARYLMGVGTPQNILNAIELGVDMFDCVMPTRNARNGTLFTTTGKVNIRNAAYKDDHEPLDAGIPLYASTEFSRGYVRHLFAVGEILGLQLATQQNLAFYLWLVTTARQKIQQGCFRQWKSEFLSTYYPDDARRA